MQNNPLQSSGSGFPASTTRSLAPAIRASLQAKLERLLARPVIAAVLESLSGENNAHDDDESPGVFRALKHAARSRQPSAGRAGGIGAWSEHPEDGTCSVRVRIDYADLWRGREKEILETVRNTVESSVTFLTEEQKTLLERSPREFLALNPRPECAELLTFDSENIGGSERVASLTVAALPISPASIRYITIVPNLVQIERQLDALDVVENAADEGPLAPLRALLGLSDPSRLQTPRAAPLDASVEAPGLGETLDEYQAECVRKAITTPHFAVIQGPPGSAKTTVITSVIRRATTQGSRVLVVSPTHVAVDNVVEKLVAPQGRLAEDRLDPHTMPVRYAARKSRLSERALEYWVGNKKQLRAATLSRRIEQRLSATFPFARALYLREDKNTAGNAPLSSAVSQVQDVICGTPIGILSYAPIGNAAAGEFDLLIVDEVSKMTLPEFLAIAVKARRWILVGDPDQLPPFNNSEENASTLDDVLSPLLEVVCSVGAVLERARPFERRAERLVVVTSNVSRCVSAICAHLAAVKLENTPPVAAYGAGQAGGIIVCTTDEVDDACDAMTASRERDQTQNPNYRRTLPVLVERGISLERPEFASGTRFVEPRMRAQALIFENAFNVYHAQPWSERNNQKLRLVGFRNGLEKYLPSVAAAQALKSDDDQESGPSSYAKARLDIAERFAVNTVSLYDWLTGIPTEYFDTSPLQELDLVSPPALREAVRPFVGALKKQYRMHASLSRVPRDLFYFGAALHDGKADGERGCRAVLVQVASENDSNGETNVQESAEICRLLEELNANDASKNGKTGIMVITPYREQQALLSGAFAELRERGVIGNLDVDTYTLDSCQGREAEYVFVSLVRSRATPFLDMPKRWNVALTRAKEGLFVVGNVDAYLGEAAKARRESRTDSSGRRRPLMSLIARIVEEYDRQIADSAPAMSRT